MNIACKLAFVSPSTSSTNKAFRRKCVRNETTYGSSDEKLVVYVTRGCVIALDSMVLALTWKKTFQAWREARRLNLQLSVTTCLLRDGS